MKLAKRRALQAKIKADLIKKHDKVCFFCKGYTDGITLVHIIRQSYSVPLSVVPENCVLGCLDCHTVFDDASGSELRSLQNLNKVLGIMKSLDLFYYNRFMDKVEV